MFWIILIIKVCHSKASIFSLLIVQFPLVRFAHFFIIAKYIFCIFENDTDILWELFFLPGYLTGTVIVYIQMENTWIWGFSCWQEKAVMCYMILVDFFNEFLLTMNLIKKTHTNVDLNVLPFFDQLLLVGAVLKKCIWYILKAYFHYSTKSHCVCTLSTAYFNIFQM